jgi:hydrogenase nickel incorporation protein HypA/HybF
MHELGIVFHIIDSVKNVAIKNNVKHVNSVTLEVGEVSTLIPSYLIDCWNWAVQKEELMTNCKLNVEVIKAETYCTNCGKTYETVKYAKVCPYCKSEETYLIKGNEKNIKEIEVI